MKPEADLFVGDFEGFIARRDELAKQLRGEGDRDAGDRIRALKKPSRVAWAINQVSAGDAELRNGLLEAGAALREAQDRLMAGKAKGAELRDASATEQAAVSRVLDAATGLAQRTGAALNPAATERARQTLHAVALDAAVREEFEAHRLTTEHEPAGLGGLSLGDASPGNGSAGAGPAAKRDAKETARRRKELKAAEGKVRELEERREQAERKVAAAREAAEGARRELERATRDLERAAGEAASAKESLGALREKLG